ncbi:hypothetical protein ES703_23844 [subsurface metagenome]
MNNHIFTAISSTKIVTFIKSSQSRIILVAPDKPRDAVGLKELTNIGKHIAGTGLLD